MAARIGDYDLKNHLEQLEAHSLKANDFMPFALKDVQEDYVGDLLYKYLQDIKHRQKAGEFGRASAALLLRKCTLLSDIDDIVEELQKRSNELLSNAERLALEMAEKARQKEIKAAVETLANRRLDYPAKSTVRRTRSFHGKIDKMLVGEEHEEWLNFVDYEKRRPISPGGRLRDHTIRPVGHTVHDIGSERDETQASFMRFGEEKEEDGGKAPDPDATNVVQNPISDLGSVNDMGEQMQQMLAALTNLIAGGG